jgi:diguanylate cyclase (GGDEF)-like protein
LLHHDPYAKLLELLEELGCHVHAGTLPGDTTGFPTFIPLPDGGRLWLESSDPGLLANLDPEHVGAVMLDAAGYTQARWGLACSLALFDERVSCLDHGLAKLALDALRGVSGVQYLDGYRFYAASLRSSGSMGVFLLVVQAHDEADARRKAECSARSAEILRKIGKHLTMHIHLQELCRAASYEIASAADLAAVLLWVRRQDEPHLTLQCAVGVRREGVAAMHYLNPEGDMTCAAEAVAISRRPFAVGHPQDSAYTMELEARFCYNPPGAVWIAPLMVGSDLIGVLEIIGKADDPRFEDNRQLLWTVAEHLALALSNALLYESMARLATFDPLTGVANHRAMQEFLSARVSEAERMGGRVGVIMLDVDEFRRFNEDEGHDAGDRILNLVAGAMRAASRDYDFVARYGGEEFTIVCPGADLAMCQRVAERVRQEVEAIDYVSRTGRRVGVTASLGCASFPETAGEPAGLLKAADIALYEAKRAGRNRVAAYPGTYAAGAGASEPDPGAGRWATGPELERGRALVASLRPVIRHMGRALGLTRAQSVLLEQLVTLSAPFRRAVAEGDGDLLARMAECEELHPLMPSLEAVRERFDGRGALGLAGEEIPLLGRALSVLLALGEEGGAPFLTDPGRFDPRLVLLANELPDAA